MIASPLLPSKSSRWVQATNLFVNLTCKAVTLGGLDFEGAVPARIAQKPNVASYKGEAQSHTLNLTLVFA